MKVKDPNDAGYPESFNKDGSHDLTKVARFESYRGFLFGSLNPDVKPLTAALGSRARFIVDANQAWDETTANRCLPVLAELGVALVEQPLSCWPGFMLRPLS